jgi:hypothetical protein
MVANQTNLEELGIWCSERLNVRFRSVVLAPLAASNVQRVWCEK